MYSQRSAGSREGGELFVNLFIGSEATTTLGDRTIKITQTTNYPWQGDIALNVDPDRAATFTVSVRIPLKRVNGGQAVPVDVAAGILMSRANGEWFTTRCGITDPGAVLAEVDQPRGNAVKLAIGILILGAVLGYSIRRVKRRDPGATLRR